jgi:hypothetical protein
MSLPAAFPRIPRGQKNWKGETFIGKYAEKGHKTEIIYKNM